MVGARKRLFSTTTASPGFISREATKRLSKWIVLAADQVNH